MAADAGGKLGRQSHCWQLPFGLVMRHLRPWAPPLFRLLLRHLPPHLPPLLHFAPVLPSCFPPSFPLFMHLPPTHFLPAGQAALQAPQLFLLVSRSTQCQLGGEPHNCCKEKAT